MLMLDLTDGDQTVKGMEYQAIKELHSDLTPGTKVYIHYTYIHVYMHYKVSVRFWFRTSLKICLLNLNIMSVCFYYYFTNPPGY